MSRRGWILLIALGVIWGMPYLLIKVAIVDFDPVVVAFSRTLIGGIVLIPLAIRNGGLRRVLAHWPAILAFTLVEISGPWLLLGHAETQVSSSTAALFIAVVPLITAAIATATRQDRITPIRAIGLAAGVLGVAALVGFDIVVTSPWALAALAMTAAGYAVGPIIMTRYLSGLPRIGVVAASLLLASAVYAPFVPGHPPARVEVTSVVAVVVLGIVCTALAFALFFELVAEVGPSRSTVITYLNPVVAFVLGIVILGESLGVGLLLGLPLILAGSILATRRSRRRDVEPGPGVPIVAEEVAR